MNNSDLDFLFMTIVGAILLITLVISIIIYIFKGIAFNKICKKENIENRWLSWMPIGNDYIMLKISKKNQNYMWLFALGFIFNIVANFVSINNIFGRGYFIVYLILSIFQYIVAVQAFKVICKKYNMSLYWFIIGFIFLPVLILALIILINKVEKKN